MRTLPLDIYQETPNTCFYSRAQLKDPAARAQSNEKIIFFISYRTLQKSAISINEAYNNFNYNNKNVKEIVFS